MIYGYARVSTYCQKKYGYGLEAQKAALKQAGAEKIYEDSFTGTQISRPGWDALVETLKEGDTLVVKSLDRISRTAVDGCTVVRELLDRGVSVNVLNIGKVEDTPIGRFIVSVMFAMSEFERDSMLEDLRSGKKIARKRPEFCEGRPRADIDEQLFADLRAKVGSHEMTVKEAAKALGVSESTWRRRVKEVDAA